MRDLQSAIDERRRQIEERLAVLVAEMRVQQIEFDRAQALSSGPPLPFHFENTEEGKESDILRTEIARLNDIAISASNTQSNDYASSYITKLLKHLKDSHDASNNFVVSPVLTAHGQLEEGHAPTRSPGQTMLIPYHKHGDHWVLLAVTDQNVYYIDPLATSPNREEELSKVRLYLYNSFNINYDQDRFIPNELQFQFATRGHGGNSNECGPLLIEVARNLMQNNSLTNAWFGDTLKAKLLNSCPFIKDIYGNPAGGVQAISARKTSEFRARDRELMTSLIEVENRLYLRGNNAVRGTPEVPLASVGRAGFPQYFDPLSPIPGGSAASNLFSPGSSHPLRTPAAPATRQPPAMLATQPPAPHPRDDEGRSAELARDTANNRGTFISHAEFSALSDSEKLAKIEGQNKHIAEKIKRAGNRRYRLVKTIYNPDGSTSYLFCPPGKDGKNPEDLITRTRHLNGEIETVLGKNISQNNVTIYTPGGKKNGELCGANKVKTVGGECKFKGDAQIGNMHFSNSLACRVDEFSRTWRDKVAQASRPVLNM